MTTPSKADLAEEIDLWVLVELARFTRERRTGRLSFDYRLGKAQGVEENQHRPRPAGTWPAPPPCPKCADPMAVLDAGQRLFCGGCRETWTDVEYHALARHVVGAISGTITPAWPR